MSVYKRSIKTNAQAISEYLESKEKEKQRVVSEASAIDLYPEREMDYNPLYQMELRKAALRENAMRMSSFKEDVKKELLFHFINSSLLSPLTEMMAMTSHQRGVLANSVVDYINENNIYEVVDSMKHKNIYLAEAALILENTYESIIEEAEEKQKEGLPSDDIYNIENNKIEDYIANANGVIPDDFHNLILDRVEDSVNDFIDDNRKNKFAIKDIYDKAKEKIAAASGVDDDEDRLAIQQEALSFARGQETKINSKPVNVFGEMVRIMTESVHKVTPLKEAYMNTSTNRIDFGKLVGDVKAMYTFMEAMNGIGLIEADDKFLQDTINDMRDSMDNVIYEKDTLDPAGEKRVPKEKDQNPDADDDNNPSNDFPVISKNI